MSAARSALKAAKSALDGQKYDEAIEQVNVVLNADPKNYHAYDSEPRRHGVTTLTGDSQ